MKVELVPANVEDKPEVWDMYVPAMRSHIEKIWGWSFEWQTNEFNNRFSGLNTSFLVVNAKRVGYVQYTLNESDSYLNMVVLKPAFQGQKLGRRVLNCIQNLQPDKRLRLRCFKVNERALSFYKKNGFKIIESDDDFVLLERLEQKSFKTDPIAWKDHV